MPTAVRRTLACAFPGSVALRGMIWAAPAETATQIQDGLVNAAVGDVTISDVNVGVAAQVCGLKVEPVAVLGRAVDRSGTTRTVCTSNQGPVTLSQN